MRTLAPVTPRGFQYPKQWLPPPDAPASSATPLAYQGGSSRHVTMLLIGLGATLFMASFFGVFFPVLRDLAKAAAAGQLGGTSAARDAGLVPSGATEDALAAVSLEQTQAQLAAQLSGKESAAGVHVRLLSGSVESVSLSWTPNHPEHPTSFSVTMSRGGAEQQGMRPSLAARLVGFGEKGYWSRQGAQLHWNPGTESLNASVSPALPDGNPNPHWKGQLSALWKVVLLSAGLPLTLTREEQVAFLGGYSLGAVARVDLLTPIESATQSIRAAFPGAELSTQHHFELSIFLDHPLFEHVTLRWENKKGGRVEYISVRPKAGFKDKRETFVACLRTSLGPGRYTETDFINKKGFHSFDSSGLFFSIGEDFVGLSLRDARRGAAATARALTAMDGCR